MLVVIRASGSDRELGEALRDALEERLEREGVLTARPPPFVAARAMPAAAQTLADALHAYQQLALDDAAASLRALADAAAENGGEGLVTDELVALWILSAATALALQDPAAADAALDHALAIAPALELDAAAWPPPVLDALERRRAVLETCEISILTSPPESVSVIDGRERPRESVSTLPCGLHLVHARAPGHRSAGRAITLVPHEPASLELALEVDVPSALASPGAPYTPVSPVVMDAARALGAELLVVDVDRGADGSARARLVGAGRDASARADDADVDTLLRQLVHEQEAPSTVDPWPWVGIAIAVVAVAAAGTALGVALSPGPSGFDVHGSVAP